MLGLNLGKPASCLGRIPVYHPKGISHSFNSSQVSLLDTIFPKYLKHVNFFFSFFPRGFWQEIWWTGTSTTRWAERSLVTRWSSTILIENKLRRKGQSFFGPKIKNYIQYRDVSSMATVLQDIGKFRKQIQRRHKDSDLLEIVPSTNSRFWSRYSPQLDKSGHEFGKKVKNIDSPLSS